MLKKKNQKSRSWSFSAILGSVIILAMIADTIYVGARQWLEDKLLNSNAKTIKAVVISEKNYLGNSPVSQEYTYSYSFMMNGKIYKDDSHDTKYSIGDSVSVEYLPSFPSFNRVAENKKN